MTVLSGGCLCCQIKGALSPTLKNLWMAWNNAEPKPFERIIIETSGVASPEPILDTLLREPWLSKRYRLQQIVTTLAIPSAIVQLERHAEARAQMAWADLLLLTHADLANSDQQAELYNYLKIQAPTTLTLTASPDSIDPAEMQRLSSPVFRHLPAGNAAMEHGFHSLSLYFENAPDWPCLQAALQTVLTQYPDDLLRIKGVVYPPASISPWAVHAVAGHCYPPVSLPERPNQDRRSRLVLITSSEPAIVASALLAEMGDEFGQ